MLPDGHHLHLVLNHVPILGTLFALVLGVGGLAFRSPALVRAAFVALVVCGAAAVGATQTGEPAEHAVENLAGVSEAAIEAHEEAAETANYAAIGLALAALVGLVLGRTAPVPTWAVAVVLVGALAVFGLMARTGNLGGQIRHPEIAGPGGTPPPNAVPSPNPGDARPLAGGDDD